MFRRLTSVFIAAVLTLPVVYLRPVAADSIAGKEDRMAEKVKTEIAKLGVGREARIKVKLKDKTKVDGYLSEVTENYFTVADYKTGHTTVVAYPDVTQVQGHNLSKGAKIAIAVGVIAGVIIVLYIVKGAFCDGC